MSDTDLYMIYLSAFVVARVRAGECLPSKTEEQAIACALGCCDGGAPGGGLLTRRALLDEVAEMNRP